MYIELFRVLLPFRRNLYFGVVFICPDGIFKL